MCSCDPAREAARTKVQEATCRRPCSLPFSLPGIFVGSFLLEVFFSIPGLGREIITAVNRSDFPVIKAVTVYLAILTMIINLLVDVMYKYVDPRVSFK